MATNKIRECTCTSMEDVDYMEEMDKPTNMNYDLKVALQIHGKVEGAGI